MRSHWAASGDDDTARPLTAGERAVSIVLWTGCSLAIGGSLIYFAVVLRRTDHAPVTGALLAFAFSVPGTALGGLFVPAIRAARLERYARAGWLSGMVCAVAAIVCLSYIVSLAGSCGLIPGCRQRQPVIYAIALSQFLFLFSWLSALGAALISMVAALRRRRMQHS